MKTVVLIGDSIRMGYENTVREQLDGLAVVHGSTENGEKSDNVLDHLEDWAISLRPDVVHLNCGLHDIKREFGQSENAVPLARYKSNVRQILDRLQTETDAVVLWASTTPINERQHNACKPFQRFAEDVTTYNRAAAEIARTLDVPINDLFARVHQAGVERDLTDDGVHFSSEGSVRLGRAVAEFIRPYLQGDPVSARRKE